jgi:16S rRNA (cytidine1402-2'-O)-methyltransferase
MQAAMRAAMRAGTLYLVATPIGNLEDITLRAIRILKESAIVACEDTRRTRGLLSHLGLRTPTTSLHEHNERARIAGVLEILRGGGDVALVSDAGTPVVSDPGAAIVAAVAAAGLLVVSIPGSSAVTAAVPLADFDTERFAFIGFLPRRGAERERLLAVLAQMPMAWVLFESPRRVRRTLAEIGHACGDRRVLVARELTKVHEQVARGTVAEVLAVIADEPKGEVTIVVAGAPATTGAAARDPITGRPVHAGNRPALEPDAFLRRLLDEGLSRRDAAKALALAYAIPPKDAYRMANEVA